MNAQIWIAVLVGLAATIDDLKRRHIANWIPAAALAGGLGWQMGRGGSMGLLTALGGAAAGFSVFLVFYLLGGMGGGDIKLMAGFGALLGPVGICWAAFWTAGVGGILALMAIGWKFLRNRINRGRSKSEDLSNPADEHNDSIPYAPAIALGVWLSLVPKG